MLVPTSKAFLFKDHWAWESKPGFLVLRAVTWRWVFPKYPSSPFFRKQLLHKILNSHEIGTGKQHFFSFRVSIPSSGKRASGLFQSKPAFIYLCEATSIRETTYLPFHHPPSLHRTAWVAVRGSYRDKVFESF